MRELSRQELAIVSGSMSETVKNCFEGGVLGFVGGAVIGGVIASPAYFMLMNQDGISSSHHLIGGLLVMTGTMVGGFLGSFIGTGGGWLASCTLHEDSTHH